MNQSLEKIIIIGLNLTLLISIGVPLLLTTTQVISETEESLTFQQFVQEIDETILAADESQITITKHIFVPNNTSLEAENNILIFKVYLDTWYAITRLYRCPLQLEGPKKSGAYMLTINATELLIQIVFQQV